MVKRLSITTVGQVIYYALADRNMFYNVTVPDFNEWSDHAPTLITLEAKSVNDRDTSNQATANFEQSCIDVHTFNPQAKQQMRTLLENNKHNIEIIFSDLAPNSAESIVTCVETLSARLIRNCDNEIIKRDKPWFDDLM